jgi:uncharacterized membrane protein
MTTTTSYFLRPRVLLIWAALAASVMAVVLASPASTAQTTVQAGTPLAWGYNNYGQSDIPSGLTDVVDMAGGTYHSLALKSDGTVVAWGLNQDGQSNVPSGLTGVIDVAGGTYHSLALKSDGTVVAWGDNFYGQSDVPSGLTGVVNVAAGAYHNLAVKQVAELGPTSKADCKNGGYKDFGFKNQGQCIKAVKKAS